jgi:uncharacterized protein (TIGR02271 family)
VVALLPVPGFGIMLAFTPVVIALTGIVLGIIIGGGIGGLIELYNPGISYTDHPLVLKQVLKNAGDAAKIQLREEQLNISKKWVRTGDVSIHKEVLKEEKTITVPVIREELVIEKKSFDKKAPEKLDVTKKIFRIPVSTERIEIIKHPVYLNNVSIYKHRYQETRCVNETIKKDKVHMEVTGAPNIVNK